MGIQSHFDTFHNAIKLNRADAAYKTARQRDDSIKADVMAAFIDAAVVADFIQGSLKTNTGVKPVQGGDYDIDRALVIEGDDAPDNPVTPKARALDVLESRGFENAKIKKPCVTADYTGDSVHIDFIIYKRWGDQHYLAVGKRNSDENNREWSSCDPYGLIDWINDGSEYVDDPGQERAQFQRIVRYLKRWRDVQFSEAVAAKVYSIGLTVMAKEQFQSSFSNEGARQDLAALRVTAASMLVAGYFVEEDPGQYRVCVELPAEPWRDIFHGSSLETGTQFRNKLARLMRKLDEVAAEVDERKQCQALNELFGDHFKVPESHKCGSRKVEKAVFGTYGTVVTSQGA